jgi:hypothetical protein
MEANYINSQLVPAEDRNEVYGCYLDALHEFQRRQALKERF